ncbi:UDP-N-acetylenolpyruvoylglucosamine reductase [Candidatus Peregrinibacteria bacterium RIFOXYB2_FULL_32_7]|nr:MAG: UDP-N-acetylenolpyruvoylglucosamine reductase [Candidatus Peregrinibacteria bacterium RIFOXYB2_FULL_32_7]
MLQQKYSILIQKIPDLKSQEFLSNHCTFRIGGPADLFWNCSDINLLPEFLKITKNLEIPYFIFGGGSNILFDSNGFRGLVIKITDSNFEFINSSAPFLKASAGARMALLAKESFSKKLTGLEWANGLPGTLGGAIYGNAGCHDCEIADLIENVTLYDFEKGIFEVKKDYFDFKYRDSKLKKTKEIVLKATLKLKNTNTDLKKSKEAVNFRAEKQPWGFTTGSFFKNPEGDSAGRLIDSVGLKGYQIGEAKISEKHANFFMNLGHATSDDILKLRALAKEKVMANFGIELEDEIIIVNS